MLELIVHHRSRPLFPSGRESSASHRRWLLPLRSWWLSLALAGLFISPMTLVSADALALRCAKGTRVKTVRDGRRRMRVCVKRKGGQRHGDFVRYHRSGRRQEAGTYKHGRRDGPYRIWHRRGALIETGLYVAGKRSGERKRFYRSGKKYALETWLNGERTGLYHRWYRNSHKRGMYLAGRETGVWIVELYTGERKQTTFIDGRKQGVFEAFGRDGQRVALGRFGDNRQTGLWQGWWPNGAKRYRRTYVDGKRHGSAQQWHPGGKLAEDCGWVNGRRDGPGKRWSPEGKLLLEGQWHAGHRHGEFRAYYPDGSLESVSHWAEDQVTGRQDRYWPGKGQLMVTAHWLRGHLEGPWARYARDGSVEIQGTFHAGELVGGWRTGSGSKPTSQPGAQGGRAPSSTTAKPRPSRQKRNTRSPTKGAGASADSASPPTL